MKWETKDTGWFGISFGICERDFINERPIKSLNLSQCALLEDDCIALDKKRAAELFLDLLQQNRATLTEIDLYECSEAATSVILASLLSVAPENLQKISIGAVDLFRESFFGNLNKFACLKKLAFGRKSFPFDLVDQLVEFLAATKQVESLAIGTTRVGRLVPGFVHLRELFIACNDKADDFSSFAVYLKQTTTLKHLSLTSPAESAVELMRRVALNRSLYSLTVQDYVLKDADLEGRPLERFLRNHGGLRSLSVHHMDWDYYMPTKQVKRLTNAILKQNSLASLYLDVWLTTDDLCEFARCGSIKSFSYSGRRLRQEDDTKQDVKNSLARILQCYEKTESLAIETFRIDHQMWLEMVLPVLQSDVGRVINFRDFSAGSNGVVDQDLRNSIVHRNRVLQGLFSHEYFFEEEGAALFLFENGLPLYVVLRIIQFVLALKACEIEEEEVADNESYWHSLDWFVDYQDTKKRAEMVWWLQELEKDMKRE